jgi:hypothetical protein
MAIPSGTRLGPYEILSPLGAGGMGEVYRARDTRLGREVAIKVLSDEIAGDPRALARFQTEAKAIAALSHPNIMALHDVGEASGIHFAVMELLDGETLRAALCKGPMPVRRALEIAGQLAEALAAAHEKGIVHRDVKPENVVISKGGHAKLLDFGLAGQSVLPSDPAFTNSPTGDVLTERGAILGTVAYMSPEQARGENIDFRSDQFSLGIVLYEMLAGSRPFQGTSGVDLLAAIVRDEPEPLEKRAKSIPSPISWIVERLLSKDLGGRYHSTRDLASELATVRAHLSEAVSGAGQVMPFVPGRPGRRSLVLGGAVLALVAVVAGALVDRWLSTPRLLHVERLTPSPRIISSARFLPDGKSIVYTAAPDGSDAESLGELFRLRPGEPPVGLGVRDCRVLDVSASGELILVWKRESAVDGRKESTLVLARIPAAGGTAPRVVEEEGVSINDRARWTRDGRDLIVKHNQYKGKRTQVIVFQGRPLYEVPHGFGIGSFILNELGDGIGFVEMRATGRSFVTVGLDGRVATRTPVKELSGMGAFHSVFSFRQHLVCLSVRDENENPVQLAQLSTSGVFQRVLQNLPTDAQLWDISPAGDMLTTMGGQSLVQEVRWLEPGADRERLLDLGSLVLWPALNASGTQLSCTVNNMSFSFSTVLLRAGLSTATRLGEGAVFAQAPDGKTLLTSVPDPDGYWRLRLLPTGAGAPRNLPGKWINDWNSILLDGGKVFVYGRLNNDSGENPYLLDVQAGSIQRLDWHADTMAGPVSPDGRTAFTAATTQGDPGRWSRVDLASGALTPLPSSCAGMTPRGWNASGEGIWLTKPFAKDRDFPAGLWRCDLKTGKVEKVGEITGPDYPLAWLSNFTITPDGRSYAYGCSYNVRVRKDLFRVSGAL